ncbi:trace amine-associated receptor 6-like [Pygocentrus nattereri]|uniref:trace amine-associated receptor 6-like n=1 Tax=Pygocentrus nattereri TaxID=42514 RepID=UPI001891D179|nr:trace amine-associated receptor 6-like [Pygocentrus nattereri]
MNNTEYQQNITVQYCFPDNNASCRKELHTPTNLLILSLAVADLLVGLFVMPVNIMQLITTCWYLGKVACSIFPVINSLSLSGSLCSLILIAVDRYIAVSDPLLYSSRITVCKMSLYIILGWSFCLLYVIIFMYSNDHLTPSQMSTRCYGQCVLIIKHSWVIAGIVISFLAPCSVILVLYSLIFNVARHQAKAIRAVKNGASHQHGVKVLSSSETKAAKTLSIVIVVYLSCWIPYYICSLFVKYITSLSVMWILFIWLILINSCMNPLIYAIFYQWFRASVKYIVTCRIFESSSSRLHLFSDHV